MKLKISVLVAAALTSPAAAQGGQNSDAADRYERYLRPGLTIHSSPYRQSTKVNARATDRQGDRLSPRISNRAGNGRDDTDSEINKTSSLFPQ